MAQSMSSCGHCGAYFGAESDVVTCSVCGKSHHRSCWSMTGRCSNPGCPGSPLGTFSPGTMATHSAEVSETRKCPFCAETIRADAIKCRYCQSMLYQAPNPVKWGEKYGSYDERRESSHSDEPSDGLMTFLYIITFFVPIVGIVVGAIYSNRDDYETKGKGRSLLTFGIVMIVLGCICGIVLGLAGA